MKILVIGLLLLGNIFASELTKEELLGQSLFFDKSLSLNSNQSCATCHNPEKAFIDSRSNGVLSMASLGDDLKSLGDRQAPTITYAKYSPKFYYDKKKKKYIGGQFWDGRAATLKDQAGGPFLNPIEMNMPSKEAVIKRISLNEYHVNEFKSIYGNHIFDDVNKAYEALTKAIESYEKTKEFSTFDSKYDKFLKGEYDLTVLEDLGRTIFFSNNNNSCASCHVLKGEDKAYETFTNYEYHNIGTPENRFLRSKNNVQQKDLGLYNHVKDFKDMKDIEKQKGKYKVPTLRNVAVTEPYMHNGVFKDLKTVVLFYDKYNNKNRTINPETSVEWNEPEVKDNISLDELKAKRLSDRKVDALVAFMKILTDERYEHLLEK